MISMHFPFSIGGGRVTTSTEESRIIQGRIMLCLGTFTGERVMRPGWGINLMNHVHAVGGSSESVMEEAIREAWRTYFSKYELVKLSVMKDRGDPSTIHIELRYRKPNSKAAEKMVTSVRMPDGSVSLTGEVSY